MIGYSAFDLILIVACGMVLGDFISGVLMGIVYGLFGLDKEDER